MSAGTAVRTKFASPAEVMRHALSLAERGLGFVEPNPMVGAVVVNDSLECLGEGRHERFGGPHAEVHAIERAGSACRGATLYVTLEPCSHHGKTPPCADAVIAAGFRKVVVAVQDPAPHVDGRGIARLREAGIDVDVGLLEAEGRRLIAPFVMLMLEQRPWVTAKWAMTLDGRIATRTGHSQWISNEASRAEAHRLRGRMDAVLVGVGTVLADDPLLTARPLGARVATRVVLDSRGRTPPDSRLCRSTSEAPLLIATTNQSPESWRDAMRQCGAEILLTGTSSESRVPPLELLHHLGQRRMTNLLVEGGGEVLGSFFDAGLIDECYIFVAPCLAGGENSPGPLGGLGLERISERLTDVQIRTIGDDVLIRGRVCR